MCDWKTVVEECMIVKLKGMVCVCVHTCVYVWGVEVLVIEVLVKAEEVLQYTLPFSPSQ